MTQLGLFPIPTDENELGSLFTSLAHALSAHHYGETVSLPFPGGLSQIVFDARNLQRYFSAGRNAYESSSIAPLLYKAFELKRPDALRLFEVFSLGRAITEPVLVGLIGRDLVERLHTREMIVRVGDGSIRSRVLATPFDGKVYLHDCYSIRDDEKADHVFLGRCSMRLSDHVAAEASRRTFERALDLCTGSGIQALNSAHVCAEVFGGDINSRALALAKANATANGIANARFVFSDLFEKFDGKFDLVTANTPFLLLAEGSTAVAGYGGHLGMEVELRLFEHLDAHLNDDGVALIVASTVLIDGRDELLQRLGSVFAGTGYEIDLHPVSAYYEPRLHALYRKHSIERCVLYVVRAHKTGAETQIRAHRFAPILAAAFSAHVHRNRLQGWMAQRARG